MKINKLIVHEIIKSLEDKTTELFLSEKLLAINDRSITLITDLNKSYISGRLTIMYAEFDKESQASFPAHYKKYSIDDSEESFLTFTKDTAKDLKDKIQKINFAKGGFLVFADFEDHGHFLGIFLIRNTNGMVFPKINNSIEINDAIHVDFEKMAMGCRINYDSYISKEKRYLSFVARKNEDLSEYFKAWISVKNSLDNKADTKILHQIINNIELPLDENGKEIEREQFKSDVVRYIKGLPTKTVIIAHLSNHFFKDELFIANYIKENKLAINSEFKADISTLNRFENVKVKSEEIEISFPHKLYQDKIYFDSTDPSKIIIKSNSLAEKLKLELEK